MEPSMERWQSHPVGSAAVRAAVFLVPVAASVTASLLTVRLLPREPGGANLAMRWGVAIVVSTMALRLTERVARRFLPLAVLLRLSLAFPNEAPNRLRLARSAGSTRELARIVERARAGKESTEPALAASEVLALVSAVEAHDRGTRGHSERVRVYTDMLSEQLRLAKRDRDRLRWAALLHDVGKLIVPQRILTKPGAPDAAEWEVLHRHPAEGARLTATLQPWLGEWADAIAQHHERWDGSGYPRGLSGAQISYGARIVAVADCYETMTARRPYRKALRAAHARAELVRCSGSQFDPAIVRAFLEISVRRVQNVAGPVAWLAQTPLIRGVEQAATSGAAAVGGTALVLGMVPPATQPVQAPRPRPGIHAPAADTRRDPLSSTSADPSRTPTLMPTAPGSGSPTVEPSPEASSTRPRILPTLRRRSGTPSPSPDQSQGPLPSTFPSKEG